MRFPFDPGRSRPGDGASGEHHYGMWHRDSFRAHAAVCALGRAALSDRSAAVRDEAVARLRELRARGDEAAKHALLSLVALPLRDGDAKERPSLPPPPPPLHLPSAHIGRGSLSSAPHEARAHLSLSVPALSGLRAPSPHKRLCVQTRRPCARQPLHKSVSGAPATLSPALRRASSAGARTHARGARRARGPRRRGAPRAPRAAARGGRRRPVRCPTFFPHFFIFPQKSISGGRVAGAGFREEARPRDASPSLSRAPRPAPRGKACRDLSD